MALRIPQSCQFRMNNKNAEAASASTQDNETFLAGIGKNVRMAREALKLPQSQLAVASGIRQAHLSDIERGTVNVTILTLRRIALALHTNVTLLIPE